MSFPNQKKAVIHKEECVSDFLQINNTEWRYACRVLSPSAFEMYLYLASNINGFHLWLSREDVYKKIGIAKTAYYNGLKDLERFGYLIERTPSIYEFSTTPIRSDSVIDAWRQRSLYPRFLVDKGIVPNYGNDGRTFGTPFPLTSKEIYNNIDNYTLIKDVAASRSFHYGKFEKEPREVWFARLPESERSMRNM